MKAIGMHIFCGSQTIGHLLEGWKIDTVLEISEDMPNQNAYHFIKNYGKDIKYLFWFEFCFVLYFFNRIFGQEIIFF